MFARLRISFGHRSALEATLCLASRVHSRAHYLCAPVVMRALHAWFAQHHIVFQQNAHRMPWTQFYQPLLRESGDV
jgi:hypothetical protein